MKTIIRILGGVGAAVTYFANFTGLMFATWFLVFSGVSVTSKAIFVVFAAIVFILGYLAEDVGRKAGGERNNRNHDE